MKIFIYLFFLLFIALALILIISPKQQKIEHLPVIVKKSTSTCIALVFTADIPDSMVFKTWVRSEVSLEEFDNLMRVWVCDDSKCNCIQVRTLKKDYTFTQFRKLIYE